MKKALFPGSFNLIHQGHINIIKKASKLFDFVYVVISENNEKKTDISLEKRYKKAKENLPNIKNIKLIISKGILTAQLARKLNCNYIIRSGRNNIDYKYELELAAANNSINHSLETILIIPDYNSINYKSRLLKQIKK